MALLVWKEMDADLPETKKADWPTEPSAPPPDPSPFRAHRISYRTFFAHTYQTGG